MKGKLFCILLVHVNLSLSLSLHVKLTIHNFVVPTTWELNFECVPSKFKLIQQKLCRFRLGCHNQCFFPELSKYYRPAIFIENYTCMSKFLSGRFPLNHNSFSWCKNYKMKFSGRFFISKQLFRSGSFCFLFLIRTVMIWFRALLPICMPFLISAPH